MAETEKVVEKVKSRIITLVAQETDSGLLHIILALLVEARLS